MAAMGRDDQLAPSYFPSTVLAVPLMRLPDRNIIEPNGWREAFA
jgi:hypothetical protein